MDRVVIPASAAKDISAEVFGKYQFCTMADDGLFYADSDYTNPGGFGRPKRGSMPAPGQGSPEKDRLAASVRAEGGYGHKRSWFSWLWS